MQANKKETSTGGHHDLNFRHRKSPMAKLEELEHDINKIRERNARVEGDKAWETSFARRIIITCGTYVFAALFLLAIDAPNPFLAASVPAAGFLFSTLTLPFLKDRWLGKRRAG